MTSERPPEKVIKAAKSGRKILWWVGIAIFCFAVLILVRNVLAVTLGEDVDGVVAAIETERSSTRRAGDSEYPVIEFTRPKSDRIVRQRTSSSSGGHFIGEQLRLKYWPVTGTLIINTFWGTWFDPIILFFAGSVAIGVGKLMASIDPQPKQQPPA